MFPAGIPVTRSFLEPNEPLDTVRSSLISSEFKHSFDNDWAVTSRFLAARSAAKASNSTRSARSPTSSASSPATDQLRSAPRRRLVAVGGAADLCLVECLHESMGHRLHLGHAGGAGVLGALDRAARSAAAFGEPAPRLARGAFDRRAVDGGTSRKPWFYRRTADGSFVRLRKGPL